MRDQDLAFHSYFPVSDMIRRWGLYLIGVGSYRYEAGFSSYPSNVHPDDYMFVWKRGRVLRDYSFFYISRGQGEFESIRTGTIPIEEGSVVMLFPGEWHRYRPDPETGWDEYWAHFSGDFVNHWIEQKFFTPKEPVIPNQWNEAVLETMETIFDRVRYGSMEGQLYNAADLSRLLTMIVANRHHKQAGGGAEIVQKMKLIFAENVYGDVSMQEVSDRLHLSVKQLRNVFQKHQGITPYQYFLDLKIIHAKTLLSQTRLSVKQVSDKLGFDCPFHFSNLFKKKTGKSPKQWRSVTKND